jgi:hypothetical protein
MKDTLHSFFNALPTVALKVHFYGFYRDALAACDTHPELVAPMLDALELPPTFDALRPQMTALKASLTQAVGA